MACNIWLNFCIFLIGTDFWRFIPRDSLKLWSDKSVGGYIHIEHYIPMQKVYIYYRYSSGEQKQCVYNKTHTSPTKHHLFFRVPWARSASMCLSLFWSSLLHICLLFKNIRWHVWNIHFWNLGMPGTSH